MSEIFEDVQATHMRTFFILLILVTTIPAFCQNHFVGIKAGPTLANMDWPLSADFQNRVGINSGFTYDYHLNKWFNVGADLLYFQKGFKLDVIQTDQFGNAIETLDFKFNFDYLLMPLKAGLMVGDKLSGFANLGIIPSFLILAKSNLQTVGVYRVECNKRLSKI